MVNSIESVLRDFKFAKNPISQIKIIAQLNCVHPNLIERILREELGDEVVTHMLGRPAKSDDAKPSTTLTYRQSLEKEKEDNKAQARQACRALVERSNNRKAAAKQACQALVEKNDNKKVEEQQSSNESTTGRQEMDNAPKEEHTAEAQTKNQIFRYLPVEKRNSIYEAVKNGITYKEFLVCTGFDDSTKARSCYRNLKQKEKRDSKRAEIRKHEADALFVAKSAEQLDSAKVYSLLLEKRLELTDEQLAIIKDKLNNLANLENAMSQLLAVKLNLINEINELLK